MRTSPLRSVRLLAVVGLMATLGVAAAPASAAPPPAGFSRLFPDLPAFLPPSDALVSLGSPTGPMFDPNLDTEDNPAREPSGFTYFGQFVDHDVTLDKLPFTDSPVNVDDLTNTREAALNLDSVFGAGPQGNPELYDSQKKIILSAGGRDVQRRPDGSAVLVEGRNDENQIVLQVHVAVARYYNRLIDEGASYKDARHETVLAYQWIVLNDFLPRVVGAGPLHAALNDHPRLYRPGPAKRMQVPVEFSVAAYRFGHSMVRKAYVLGADQLLKVQVFNTTGVDLHGGRPLTPDRIIQWSNFVEVPGTTNPQPPVNVSRKIDPLLSSGLFTLPPGAIPTGGPDVLAQRNLIRGKSYGLPSGQAVAVELGYVPLTNAQLGLTDPRLTAAPLWYYVLAEAKLTQNGAKLGPVGATIVADVFTGLMRKDKDSLLHGSNRDWTPPGGPTFRLGDFLKFAGVA